MSADQIRNHTFRETGIGRRRYRPEDVDLILGRLASEVERWSAAYAEAQAEIHRLKGYFREHPVDAESIRARALSAEAVHVLARAQQQADQLIADAQSHARAMQTDARAHAEAIVAEARQHADSAAHAYRARAGGDYSTDREQVERLAALGRSILGTLNGATTQMDDASAQMRAVTEAFATELTKLIGEPADSYVGRAAAPLPTGEQRR
jgi:cell division septum initiation protein DivIVA